MEVDGVHVRIGGIAKGSGMIPPGHTMNIVVQPQTTWYIGAVGQEVLIKTSGARLSAVVWLPKFTQQSLVN